MKKITFLFLLCAFFLSCASTPKNNDAGNKDEITLLFAGDVMAHSPNYNMKDYEIIWDGIRDIVSSADLAFANIEAPVDTTKDPQNYPYFNMPLSYVQSTINAGFDVFSLCNNHTNDQGLEGIKETTKSFKKLFESEKDKGNTIYYSGLKEKETDEYSYNIIQSGKWKILFLPMTEILNRPLASKYINSIIPDTGKRVEFINYCKKLREKNECDLFILSWHANETEYIRTVTDTQEEFYKNLLDAGVDIIWANHAHIIKDRKIILNSSTNAVKIIMYANGNTISAQRTKPNLSSKNPVDERDNTGDGLLYKVILAKDKKNSTVTIIKAEPVFITTYITPQKDYLIKIMNEEFIEELLSKDQIKWADYIRRRIKINKKYTKDIIEWQ
ncbi:MAG: CapA family protein [Treponema sp.]|nr:CapA family protein [Treponema sp.]